MLFQSAEALENHFAQRKRGLRHGQDRTAVTEGRPVVTDVKSSAWSPVTCSLALSLESRSDHPLARTPLYARKVHQNAQERSVTDFEMIEGQVSAQLDWRAVLRATAGCCSLTDSRCPARCRLGDEFAAAGKTPLFLRQTVRSSAFLRSADVLKLTSRRQSSTAQYAH